MVLNKLLKEEVVTAGEPISEAWAAASALKVAVNGFDPVLKAGLVPSELTLVFTYPNPEELPLSATRLMICPLGASRFTSASPEKACATLKVTITLSMIEPAGTALTAMALLIPVELLSGMAKLIVPELALKVDEPFTVPPVTVKSTDEPAQIEGDEGVMVTADGVGLTVIVWVAVAEQPLNVAVTV